MNEHRPVNQIVPAEPQRDGPSLFVGIGYVRDQITICANKIKNHDAFEAVREMNDCMESKYESGTKAALDAIVIHSAEIEKIARQMKDQAAHTAELIARHLNRRPRP